MPPRWQHTPGKKRPFARLPRLPALSGAAPCRNTGLLAGHLDTHRRRAHTRTATRAHAQTHSCPRRRRTRCFCTRSLSAHTGAGAAHSVRQPCGPQAVGFLLSVSGVSTSGPRGAHGDHLLCLCKGIPGLPACWLGGSPDVRGQDSFMVTAWVHRECQGARKASSAIRHFAPPGPPAPGALDAGLGTESPDSGFPAVSWRAASPAGSSPSPRSRWPGDSGNLECEGGL